MTMKIKRADVVKSLRALVRESGSPTVAAERMKVSRQHVCDILKGRKRPGTRVLRFFGLRLTRLELYERVPVKRKRCA